MRYKFHFQLVQCLVQRKTSKNGRRKKCDKIIKNLCEKYCPPRRFQNDRVQSNNEINRKSMRCKFGKISFLTETRKTGKNGRVVEDPVEGGKSSEAGACHKCAQHRTLLDYKPTLLLFVHAGLVLPAFYTREVALWKP